MNPAYARHMGEAEYAALSGEEKQRMYSAYRSHHYDSVVAPRMPERNTNAKTRKGRPIK